MSAAGGALRLHGPPLLVLVLGWLVLTTVGPLADTRVNDLYVYGVYADALDAGLAPYRELELEYPPLALLPIWLAAQAGGGAGGYEVTFGVLTLALTAAQLPLAAGLARAAAPDAGERAARLAVWVVALTPLFCGASVRTHFDAWPVLLMLGGLLLLVRDRPGWAGGVLGLGAMAKGFPALLVPLALAWLLGRGGGEVAGGPRAAARLGGAFAAVCLLVSAPFLGEGYLDAYRFHLERPVQIESTPASVILALGDSYVTGTDIRPDRFKSNGLAGGVADGVAALFSAVLLGTLAALTALAAARRDPAHLLTCALAALLAFVALGKVLSPQFMLWLVPALALALVLRARVAAAGLGVALALTLVEFPVHYRTLVEEPDGWVALLVGARNAALVVALSALLARAAAPVRSRRRVAARPS